jgi:hypothetical protein
MYDKGDLVECQHEGLGIVISDSYLYNYSYDVWDIMFFRDGDVEQRCEGEVLIIAYAPPPQEVANESR